MLAGLALLSLTGGAPGVAGFRELSCLDEVAGLAVRLHTKISVSRELAGHYMCVDAEGQDASQELAAVVAALRAELRPDVLGYRIAPSKAALQSAQTRWEDWRATWIQAKLTLDGQLRKGLSADSDPRAAFRQALASDIRASDRMARRDLRALDSDHSEALTPAGGLLLELLSRIGRKELAALAVNRQALFSTKPFWNETQLPDCEDLLQRYSDAMEEVHSEQVPKDFPPIMSGDLVGVGRACKPISLLRLSVRPQEAYLGAVLEGYDSDGAQVCRGSFDAMAFADAVSSPAVQVTLARPSMPGDPAKLPDELLVRAIRASSKGPEAPPDWLLRPTKFEPLTAMACFGVENLAQVETPGPAVIDVDDEMASDAPYCVKGDSFSVCGLRSVLDHWNPYESVRQGRFAVWRPADPNLPAPLVRKELKRFAQDAWSDGYVDVRSRMTLSQSRSPLVGVWVTQLYRCMPEMYSLDTGGWATMVWLLGVISDSQWDMLDSGRAESVADLGVTDALRRYLEFPAVIVKSRRLLSDLFRQHPSEMYRDADLGQTIVRLQRREEPGYRMHELQADRWTQWEPQAGGIYQVAVYAGVPTLRPGTSREAFEASLEGRYTFQTGMRRTETLSAELPGGVSLAGDLPVPPVDRSAEVSYKDLPQDLRDATWKLATDTAQHSVLGH